MFLYLPQLRSHPFAHRCPSKHETAAASPGRAVMRESEKIERLRLPKASSLTACYCMPSELDEPRLIGMKPAQTAVLRVRFCQRLIVTST